MVLCLFRNDDGVVCSLHATWTEWKGYRFHLEAYGDRGMARAYYAQMQFTKIIVGRPGGPPRKTANYYPGAIVREKLKGWQSITIAALQEEMDDFAAPKLKFFPDEESAAEVSLTEAEGRRDVFSSRRWLRPSGYSH